MDKIFRLRWVFEYHDKKPVRGVWDDGSPVSTDAAWCKDKTGLKYAVIEAESVVDYSIHRLLECEAERFVTFKWVAAVSVPSGMSSFSSTGKIVGLQLFTPQNAFTVFIDGKIAKKELSDHDKKFDLREFQTRVL